MTHEERAAARLYAALPDDRLLESCELEWRTGTGPGGQNRNKVATSLRLTHTPSGLVVTGADERGREANLRLALARLRERLEERGHEPKRRRPTRPSRAAKARRVDAKKRDGARKRERRQIDD